LLGLATTFFLDAQAVTDTSSYDSLSPHFPTDTLDRRPMDINTPDSTIFKWVEVEIWRLKGDTNAENCDFERGQLALLDSSFYYWGKSFRLLQMARIYRDMAGSYQCNTPQTGAAQETVNAAISTYLRMVGLLLTGAQIALGKAEQFYNQIDKEKMERGMSSIL
jgi:hypothetical protein